MRDVSRIHQRFIKSACGYLTDPDMDTALDQSQYVVLGWTTNTGKLTHSWSPADCPRPAETPCQSLLSWCCSSRLTTSSRASNLCGWRTKEQKEVMILFTPVTSLLLVSAPSFTVFPPHTCYLCLDWNSFRFSLLCCQFVNLVREFPRVRFFTTNVWTFDLYINAKSHMSVFGQTMSTTGFWISCFHRVSEERKPAVVYLPKYQIKILLQSQTLDVQRWESEAEPLWCAVALRYTALQSCIEEIKVLWEMKAGASKVAPGYSWWRGDVCVVQSSKEGKHFSSYRILRKLTRSNKCLLSLMEMTRCLSDHRWADTIWCRVCRAE